MKNVCYSIQWSSFRDTTAGLPLDPSWIMRGLAGSAWRESHSCPGPRAGIGPTVLGGPMHHLSSFLLLATLFLSCSPKTPPTVQPELPLPPAPVFQVTIPFEQIEKDYAATTPQPLDDAARAKALALGERFSSSSTAAHTTFGARLWCASMQYVDKTGG